MATRKAAAGNIVRLRGLPAKSSKEDVLAFLDGCGLTSDRVHLRFKERRTAGEAYVIFDNKEEAQRACVKDKDMFLPKFGERYVRVVLAEDVTAEDLHSTAAGVPSKTARSQRTASEMEFIVKVGGLPYGISPPEVRQLFFGWQVNASGVHLKQAGPHMEALVDFEVPEHAQQAVAQRHGTMITTAAGVFQLSVQKAGKAEWDALVAAQQGSDGIVKLRGLPTKAGVADVKAFLKGYRYKPGGVHVQPLSENRHSKIALVEFETAAEAVRALEMDRQRFGTAFGDRYCLLQLVHRAEFEQDRRKFQRQMAGSSGNSSSSGGTLATGLSMDVKCPAPAAVSFMSPLPSSFASPFAPASSAAIGLLPHAAAAAAAGFMHPLLQPVAPRVMLPPGYVLPPGLPPMPGSWPAPAASHMPHFQLPAVSAAGLVAPPALPSMLPGMAAASATAVPSLSLPLPPHGSAAAPPLPGSTAAARYMVQDLSTGQQVFLDPGFNLSELLPPTALASCSAVEVPVAGNTTATAASQPSHNVQHVQEPAASENSTDKQSQGHGTDGGGTEKELPLLAPAGGSSEVPGHGVGCTQAGAGTPTAKPRSRCHQGHRFQNSHHHRRTQKAGSGNSGGSSGDEGCSASGGGSNDSSDGGDGALRPADHKTDGRNGCAAEGAGGSSGRGSGASAGIAAAGICDSVQLLYTAGSEGMEDADVPAATLQQLRLHADHPKTHPCRQHSPVHTAALLADGVSLPPVKRTRSQ
ncbi:hypothetical protein D9Q98_009624 [Chlorella vulgaris]|uniref:RRM domain-containing protein n=1 Tax=Chlorella vulgaris TaxID=3077 RepID=A0A9D4YSU4_CHLVU|nr:hypothetical protein D9Q98_009624 [Chlorella vulgaris]